MKLQYETVQLGYTQYDAYCLLTKARNNLCQPLVGPGDWSLSFRPVRHRLHLEPG